MEKVKPIVTHNGFNVTRSRGLTEFYCNKPGDFTMLLSVELHGGDTYFVINSVYDQHADRAYFDNRYFRKLMPDATMIAHKLKLAGVVY